MSYHPAPVLLPHNTSVLANPGKVEQAIASVDLQHGGPDALGVPKHDFSNNSNGAGCCPHALQAVQSADCSSYPDPTYTALRGALAAFHQVDAWRIVIGASSSELIFRITALAAQTKDTAGVFLPEHHYADYARAAHVWGLPRSNSMRCARLVWLCEPSSPMGLAHANLLNLFEDLNTQQISVLDCAYEPLRLQGQSPLTRVLRDRIWQLHSPNKALGMTGVRGAYVIAPAHAGPQAKCLQMLAPSWPLGAHGQAMLHAWTAAQTQTWLANSLPLLRTWKNAQMDLCVKMGWQVQASEAHFFCARPFANNLSLALEQLREQGIKLRDCTSFGLPGWVRLNVLPPAAQWALQQAWVKHVRH